MKLILDLAIRSLVLLLTTYLVPGFTIDSYITALIVAVVLAILNLLVKPLLIFLTLPATILTLGLFLFVINAILLMLASALIKGFNVNSFTTALIASIVITVISAVLSILIK